MLLERDGARAAGESRWAVLVGGGDMERTVPWEPPAAMVRCLMEGQGRQCLEGTGRPGTRQDFIV